MDGLSPDTPLDALPRPAEATDAADRLFARALAEFGPAIARIAYANEANRELHNLEEIVEPIDPHDAARQLDDEQRLGLLNKLIGQLKPLDRQIVLLYLDDLDTTSEVTGLSASRVGVKIHRVKRLLVQLYEGHQS